MTSTTLTPDVILDAFKENGLRITGPRRALALLLVEMKGFDFTVEQLWDKVLQSDPNIGRATVFRAVEILQDLHLLDRVEFADGSHRFRFCHEAGSHHHHVTCSTCGKVTEIEACLSADQLAKIGLQSDFAIEGHRLEFFGRCSRCRK
ncbi:MAG TPA: Fur family transcriptional regulator [Ktedonobacteraceae bacterium]|nr:Fur family transcriptional regulator [Ktedonobacteraceae bacterium]